MFRRITAAVIALLMVAAAGCITEEEAPETIPYPESQTETESIKETETETGEETIDRSGLKGITIREYLSSEDAYAKADERIIDGDLPVKAMFMTGLVLDDINKPEDVEEMWNRLSGLEICPEEPYDGTGLKKEMLFVKFVWEDGSEYSFSFPSYDVFEDAGGIGLLTLDPDAVKRIAETFTEYAEHGTEPGQKETEKETEKQTETQKQTESQTETQKQTETQTETESQTQTEPETEPETVVSTFVNHMDNTFEMDIDGDGDVEQFLVEHWYNGDEAPDAISIFMDYTYSQTIDCCYGIKTFYPIEEPGYRALYFDYFTNEAMTEYAQAFMVYDPNNGIYIGLVE